MVVVPLKDYGVETTKQIQPGVSPADVAQPYKELANTMEKFGDAADTISSSMAEQAGAQSVTKDADGNIQVEKALFVGPAAAHWEHARKMAALAEADGAAQREDIKLRADFHDNPDGYLKAADQFARDAESQWTKMAGPEVGIGVRRVVERTTTQTYRGLQNETERLSLQRSSAAMEGGVKSATDDLSALARAGKTNPDDPDVKALWDKYDALQQARTSNPRLAYPKEQADYERQHLQGQLGANVFLYRTDQEYKNAPTKAEGAQRALDYAKEILTNPALKLTQNEREAYFHKAVGEIRANEAIRKQDIGEAKLASQQLIMASSMGLRIDPDQVEGVAKLHLDAGDQAGAARLYAHFARAPLNDEFGRQPLTAQTQQLSAVRGQAAAKSAYDFFVGRGYTPAQASGIVGNLIHESGLDPNSIGDAGTSVGLAQFHNERATALAQFAKDKGASPRDFQTQLEFIDKELRSTEGRAFQALQAANTPEAAAAAFIHYERPKGYDPANLGASMGFGSRVAQAKAVFGGQGNIDTGTPVSALWLQANRARTLDTVARQQWKTLWTDYEKEGIRPPDKAVNDLITAARATGDHDLLETIAAAGDRLTVAQQAAQQGLPQQEAQIAELHRQGSEGLLQAGQQGLLKDLERRQAAITTGLKDNPIATVVANFGDRFQTPPPLNIQDPQQLAAGLAYRAKAAQFGAQNWQTGPLPAMDKADLAAVSAALQNPDPAIKAGVLQAITKALPEDVRAATLQKLGEQGHDQLVAVAAGGLMPVAPDIAKSILIGQQAKATEKGYLPHQGADRLDYNDALDKALPASMFTLESRTNPTGAMAMIRGAVEARYAFLSAQAGDTKGKLVGDRLTQAITDITGGVLSHNGSKLIAPARGMTQDRFDSLLYGITDADLGNAPQVSNLAAANQALNLNPQEQALYQRHLTNLYGSGGVTNPNGSRSSLFAVTAGIGDRTYILPTVRDGKILDPDEAIKQARVEGLDKFPSYGSQGEAKARYDKLHDFMEKDTAAYLRPGPGAVTSPAGEPVTAAYLRGRAALESVGDGRYGLLLGTNPEKPIYAYTGANTEMPQKFILDMRGRSNVGVPPDASGFPAVGVQ